MEMRLFIVGLTAACAAWLVPRLAIWAGSRALLRARRAASPPFASPSMAVAAMPVAYSEKASFAQGFEHIAFIVVDVSPLGRLVIGCYTALCMVVVLAESNVVVCAVMAAICAAGMAAAVLIDWVCGLIPVELCVIIAGAGLLYQASMHGIEGVCVGLIAAVLIATTAWIAEWLVRRIARAPSFTEAVGGGDIRCMGALAIATGSGALFGCVVACCAALIAAFIRAFPHCSSGVHTFPFAPYLALWLPVGLILGG